MDKTSTTRKNLTNLSSPLEVRELNRQLEWVWRKILGGLTIKDFSEAGTKSVVTTVEKTVAETIKADEVTTNVLKSALAEMMTAKIGVADINYAQITDLYSRRIFTDSELAGKIRANRLEITSAQIVDLIVNSFRLVNDQGQVYKVTVDQQGNLLTERTADEDEMFSDGKIPTGYSAVASSLTVGDVTSGNLYVTGAADVMKLTAKYLSADSAFIEELSSTDLMAKYLIANQAFVDALYTSKIYGGDSIEIMAGKLVTIDGDATQALSDASDASAAAGKAQSAADSASSAASAAQKDATQALSDASTANSNITKLQEDVYKINDDMQYIVIKTNGTHMKARNTLNEMVLTNRGVGIYMNGEETPYSQFAANYVQFGKYQLRRTSDGGLAFKLE